ncbi:MAG TPA: serine hydroxymethyltransferase [Nitrospirae bacterium]|nr:serine hydroxymethyltransferase [Nitrospirota bacterium]
MTVGYFESVLKAKDAEVYEAIHGEQDREFNTLELIASENFTSEAVLEAQGSVMTNKYAEGYPGKRYYGGCANVDVVERLAIKRATQLFGAEHANVQPHSGSQANQAVFFTVLNPGDTIMGLNLAHGGHLTHGHSLNMSGKWFNVVPYNVDKQTETIDFNELYELARKNRPKLIIAGASAYPRIIPWEPFREIADEVGAVFMVDMAHIAGLVAVGLHPSPVELADFVTTTTHKTLRGPRSGLILCKEKYAADLNRSVFPGLQGGPMMHTIAAKAVALKEAMSDEFKTYQGQVVANCKRLASSLVEGGLRLVTGGSDTHLMLADLRNKKVTGKAAETGLDKAGITVNKNAIPFDPEKPFVASGIRIGSPAVTTRGMTEKQMEKISGWIIEALDHIEDDKTLDRIKSEVRELCEMFPLYRPMS